METLTLDMNEHSARVSAETCPVLCVDLDGTLLRSDLLWESIILLTKQQPWSLFMLPLWIIRGRAYLKRRIAERVNIDPKILPYNPEVLELLRQEKLSGKELILATASDYQPAQAIAAHLGIFSTVLASDGEQNLSGKRKCDLLMSTFGTGGFDYIGNSRSDLHIWTHCNSAMLVTTSSRLINRASRSSHVSKIISSKENPLDIICKVFRVRQWIKNVLVFLPLIAAHKFDTVYLLHGIAAFGSFSLCASSLYILNDLFDLSADRRHPKKRLRPLASGAYPINRGLLWIPTLLIGSFTLSMISLPPEFGSILGLYFLTTIAYSFFIKPMPILDVITLAGLYTLRIFAGSIAIDVSLSNWLLAFSMFFFLSLAFAKRHSELQFRKISKYQGLERRGYLGQDKDALSIMGTVSGYLSVLIFALYLNSHEVLSLFTIPSSLWLICPILLYWISRVWLFANRGAMEDDPLVTALNDPHSYFVAAAMAMIAFLAT